MEISDFELFNVRIACGERAEPAQATLVCVTAGDGRQGWGEMPLVWRQEELPLRRQWLLALLAGRSAYATSELFADNVVESPTVCCAIETALWDLIAQAAGQPLCNLWGGMYRTHIPLAVRMARGEPQRLQQSVGELVDHGYRAFVLSARGEAGDDAQVVQFLRQRIGERPEICLDAGGQYTADAALRLCAALSPDTVKCVADPVQGSDIAAVSSLARLTTMPLILSRSIVSEPSVLAAVRSGGVRGVVLCPWRLGGWLAAQRTAAVAAAGAMAIAVDVSGSVGIATVAMLHLAAALACLDQNHHTDYPRLADDVLKSPLEIADGTAAVPQLPGLGVEIDREKIEAYAID
jgi:L-alanine-DL-glutamate epimerase-like enolase superfamily enzyme